MLPFLRGEFADPGRVHTEARMTRVAIEVAREQVATFVGARPREVVFTSSGTEAIAHAQHWVRGHAVTSAVEHSAVRESLHRAASEVTVVGVDRTGRIDPVAVASAVRPDTEFVSIQLANHEVGTMQRAAIEQGAGARPKGALLHVDACAATGHTEIDFGASGADLMSITGHKLGGPKGVGALLVRRGLRVPPLLLGGAQERARRAGIENVPAIVGFGAAVATLDVQRESSAQRRLIDRAAAAATAIPGVERFGAGDLPNLLCLGIQGIEAEPVLIGLDQRGVAAHSGSSCASEMLEPSPVLAAMGVDAAHSLRVSVGWNTTDADIDRFTAALTDIVTHLRTLHNQ